MKKVVLFSLVCCLFINNGFAAEADSCRHPFKIGANNWRAKSDEYLFKTEADFRAAVNEGKYYECDSNSGFCNHNTYVRLDRNHVFGGRIIEREAYYKCDTNGNDKWIEITKDEAVNKLPLCTSTQDRAGNWIDEEADEYLFPTSEDYKYMKHDVRGDVYECDSNYCSDGVVVTMPVGHVFDRRVITDKPHKYKCVLGKPGNDGWVDITDDCEDCNKPDPKPEADPKPDPKPGKKTCEQLYPNNAEAIACCNATDADWKGGVCKCKNDTMKWEWKNGKGQCVAKDDDDNHNNGNCKYRFKGKIYCANGNYMVVDKEYPVSNEVLGGKSCDEFNRMYENDLTMVLSHFDNLCAGASLVPVGPSSQELEKAKNLLSGFKSSATSNASGWKTADGKFNTTRLASDVSAGVVLGTVGGVVSGVVIKKKQVEKGFEALHCTVGGQTVADWGDTFSVGLSK